MINLKTEKEIQIMREGGRILAEILKKLEEAVKPGITTNDLEELACELVLSYKVKGSFLGYVEGREPRNAKDSSRGDGYPNILCTSINNEIVHGIPSGRVLEEGDLLKIDMGVLHEG